MKTILCYGDSNTWGFVPGSLNMQTYYMERYARDKRWTGLLQAKLGDDFYVVEAGLNARTTNLDYKDLPGRNGKTYLLPCLYSASPIDLVVLFLGVNDLKIEFNRNSTQIAAGLTELIELIQSTKYGRGMQLPPPILLIGYPTISHENYEGGLFVGALERSKGLNQLYEALAKKYGADYLDAAPHIKLSEIDGLHIDEAGQKIFAELIYQKIKAII